MKKQKRIINLHRSFPRAVRGLSGDVLDRSLEKKKFPMGDDIDSDFHESGGIHFIKGDGKGGFSKNELNLIKDAARKAEATSLYELGQKFNIHIGLGDFFFKGLKKLSESPD